jgi:hypothetical protein
MGFAGVHALFSVCDVSRGAEDTSKQIWAHKNQEKRFGKRDGISLAGDIRIGWAAVVQEGSAFPEDQIGFF